VVAVDVAAVAVVAVEVDAVVVADMEAAEILDHQCHQHPIPDLVMVVDLEVEHHVIMDLVVEEVLVEEEIVHHHLENDQDRDHHQKELVRHPVTMHTQADIKLPFHCSKSQNPFLSHLQMSHIP